MMISDKKTIGLTTENQQVMQQLIEKKLFKEGIAAAKFAMALAINSGVEPKNAEGVGTTWNVGSFDAENELKNLIPILFPGTETPYRLVENLINTGFEIIGKQLASNANIQPADLMDNVQPLRG